MCKEVKICYADGCERQAKIKGLCDKHYGRLKRTGTIELPNKKTGKYSICKAKGCVTESKLSGYCYKHYAEWVNNLKNSVENAETDSLETTEITVNTNTAFLTPKGKIYQQGRTLDVDSEEFKEKQEGYTYPVCSVIECSNRVNGRGCCSKHNIQFRTHGKLKEAKNTVCKAENCSKDAKSRGYCSKHYAQILKHDRLTPEVEINPRGVCSVEDCDKPHKAKGYCINHYNQLKRGNIPQPKPVYPDICIVDGCEKDSVTFGYCTNHRKHMVKYGEIRPDIKSELADCKVVGCDNKRTSLGYCDMHYKQVKTHGKVIWVHKKEQGNKPETCTLEGCTSKNYARGFCHEHYYELRGKGLLLKQGEEFKNMEACEIKEPVRGVDICKEHDCNFKVHKDELCVTHYYKLKEDMKRLADGESYWKDEEDFIEV
ncbi:hypothetical protein COF68_04595 [Bacillus toyonensis]|uniref:hypothetical protein n=1 Tax=Bacillus toyonensis TaxID=155322 RepID=UPI000BFBE5D0|nr:hypothetical protein [Bacillus toyonensis]PHE64133.1 hypothetical protein COF68_04595 [Bacillus toyonensis]